MNHLDKLKFILTEILFGSVGITGAEIVHAIPLDVYVKIFWQSIVGGFTVLFMYLNYKHNKKRK